MNKILIPFIILCAICVAGCGKEPVVPEPIALGVPKEVTLKADTGSSLTFAWQAVEAAQKYAARLEYADGKFLAQKNPVEPQVTFDGLTKGETYIFKVRSVSGNETSEYSEALTVTAGGNSSEEPPVEPENPQPEDPKPEDPPVTPSDPSEFYAQFKIPAGEDLRACMQNDKTYEAKFYQKGDKKSHIEVSLKYYDQTFMIFISYGNRHS